ncbi:hypothetical protein [Clostridioides sp. ZZV14-6345]|uniref:hypothetical protein n=1 Tax=Clostridioides sp. ZZV14-6345 TaxID=2811496 RepID=UPI001D0FC52C|nr:hypothetical protein [Clostridioides sp. ZZV14-6345]
MARLTDLEKLSIDLYTGNVQEFSVGEAEDKLRKLLEEKVGGEWNYYNFQKNKWDIFAIMTELLTVTTARLVKETFSPFVEFKDCALGDTIEFKVDDDRLYDVAVIAAGTNNLLRQKLLESKVPMTSFELGIKIYAEFDEFMAGRINWAKMVQNVAKSFEHEIVSLIGKTFVSAYTGIDSDMTVTGTMDSDKLTELIEKVAGSSGNKVTIYGTKLALSKIPGIEWLESDANDKRNHGYIRIFNGVDCVEIKNTYDKDNKTWGVATDKLFIVPSGVKPIMAGFEGDAFIDEDRGTGKRQDRQLEYLFTRKILVGVVRAVNYGLYSISA